MPNNMEEMLQLSQAKFTSVFVYTSHYIQTENSPLCTMLVTNKIQVPLTLPLLFETFVM